MRTWLIALLLAGDRYVCRRLARARLLKQRVRARRLDVLALLLPCACAPCRRPRSSFAASLSPSWLAGPPRTDDETGLCELAPEHSGCRERVPRCTPSDPNCGPDPAPGYDRCYRPDARRSPLERDLSQRSPECNHDGECVFDLCTTACLSYLHNARGDPPATPFVECLGRRTRNDLLYGCVTGRCALFTQ